MKFTSTREIAAKVSTIKAYMREAIAAAKAGRKVELKKSTDFELPKELESRFKQLPALKTDFKALTPGRQRSWVIHFSGAKQSATRTARIEKAMPAIIEGRGFLERPRRG